MSSDWEADEGIGYGKPPSWTQFRKGKSGNPKGRPPKAKIAKAVTSESAADNHLRRALDRKIRVTDAKGSRVISAAEAVALAQVNKAAQGDVTAQRDVLKAQQELETRELERAVMTLQAEEERRDRKFKYVEGLRAERELAWQEAAAEGRKEPEQPWPHPEDIELDYERGTYHIRGPIDETSVAWFEYLRAEREKHFAQIIVHLRARDKVTRQKARFYASLCGIYDSLLPKRWQISHWFEEAACLLLAMPLQFVKDHAIHWQRKGAALKPFEARHPAYDRDPYKILNKAMKPLLKPLGYRSLAQFERIWEDADGDPGPKSRADNH